MRFYLLSPESVPMNQWLFPTFIKPFEEKGHLFVNSIQDADIILLDLHTRIAAYDQTDIDYLLKSGKPIASWDEYDKGGMSNLDWPYPLTEQQLQIFNHIENNNIKSVHFCRLLDKTKKDYPTNLYPYEKPIFSTEEPLLTPAELFNRPYDIFFLANSAPQREVIKKAFEEDGRFKCNIVLGAPKIPFNEWKDMCRQSKAFLKISGGGYSCERLQALWATSLMIMEDNNQLLDASFTHALNCIKINTPPTAQQLNDIYSVLKDQRSLYYIYHNQYNFVKQHYSKEAIAGGMLEKIIKHIL